MDDGGGCYQSIHHGKRLSSGGQPPGKFTPLEQDTQIERQYSQDGKKNRDCDP